MKYVLVLPGFFIMVDNVVSTPSPFVTHPTQHIKSGWCHAKTPLSRVKGCKKTEAIGILLIILDY